MTRLNSCRGAPVTANLTLPPEEVRCILDVARQQGWALVNEELELGLRSLAVPIRDVSGRVVSAMNVGADASRTSAERMVEDFLPTLQATAETLRPLLGHH